MEPSTLFTVVGTVISALLVLAGVVYTQRSVGRATARTAALEGQKVELQRVESLRQDVTDLRRQRVEDKAEWYAETEQMRTERHVEIDQLRADHARELDALRDRVGELERQRDESRAELARSRLELSGLLAYARSLLQLLRDVGVVPPPPPDGFVP